MVVTGAHFIAVCVSTCFICIAAESFNYEEWYYDRAREVEGAFYLFDSLALAAGTTMLLCFRHSHESLFVGSKESRTLLIVFSIMTFTCIVRFVDLMFLTMQD